MALFVRLPALFFQREAGALIIDDDQHDGGGMRAVHGNYNVKCPCRSTTHGTACHAPPAALRDLHKKNRPQVRRPLGKRRDMRNAQKTTPIRHQGMFDDKMAARACVRFTRKQNAGPLV